jgi:hypothetical protein
MVAGAICGLKTPNAQIPMALRVLGGLVIGGVAGCVALLIDPKQPETTSNDLLSHFDARPVARRSDLVGRFLAIAGILLCWTPFLGLVLNLIGLIVNWRTEDWARKTSMAGSVIGGVIAVGMAILMAFHG